MGYCMDFSFLGSMKVMWAGRKEIRFADLFELVKSWLGVKERKPSWASSHGIEQGPDESRTCTVNGQHRKLRPASVRGSKKVSVVAST
jgi:hypothetical protein